MGQKTTSLGRGSASAVGVGILKKAIRAMLETRHRRHSCGPSPSRIHRTDALVSRFEHNSQGSSFSWPTHALVSCSVFVAQAKSAALDANATAAVAFTGSNPDEGEGQSDEMVGLEPVSAKPSPTAGAGAGARVAFQRGSSGGRRKSNSAADIIDDAGKRNGGGWWQVRRPSALPVVPSPTQVHVARPCRGVRESSDEARSWSGRMLTANLRVRWLQIL